MKSTTTKHYAQLEARIRKGDLDACPRCVQGVRLVVGNLCAGAGKTRRCRGLVPVENDPADLIRLGILDHDDLDGLGTTMVETFVRAVRKSDVDFGIEHRDERIAEIERLKASADPAEQERGRQLELKMPSEPALMID